MNKMRSNFGIRLRLEFIAVFLEVLPEFLVVLDDSVVDDRKRRTGHVRVRVRFTWCSVRRPARMRNSGNATNGFFVERLLKFLHLAEPAHSIDGLAIQDRDSGRVVTAILEPTKAFHQYRYDISFGNSTDDSTHMNEFSLNLYLT